MAGLLLLLLSMLILSFSKTLIAGHAGSKLPYWSYQDTASWGNASRICKNGEEQSPISIATNAAIYDANLLKAPLKFSNYNGLRSGVFSNNGHTVKFQIDESKSSSGGDNNHQQQRERLPRVHDGGLGAAGYILSQIHFHWGDGTLVKGSEHIIDGRAAPLEVHFVHYNANYQSVTDAITKTDGLAVVAFLFEPLGVHANQKSKHLDTDYSQFANLIAKVVNEGNKTDALIDFGKLLPKWVNDDKNIFYRYDGSLTRPPCSEVVTWTVMEERILFDDNLLSDFINVHTTAFDEKTNKSYELSLTNNFRPTQPLNKRIVKTNKPNAIPMALGGAVINDLQDNNGRNNNKPGCNTRSHATAASIRLSSSSKPASLAVAFFGFILSCIRFI